MAIIRAESGLAIGETILNTKMYRYKWTWNWKAVEKILVNATEGTAAPTFNPIEKIRTTVAEKLHSEFVVNGHAIEIESVELTNTQWIYDGRTQRSVEIYVDNWRMKGTQTTIFLTDVPSESVSLALIALLSTIAPLIAYVIIAYFALNIFEVVNETVELLVDPDPESHVCPHCGQPYETTQALAAHIQLEHPNENPFICGQCGAEFATAEELNAHEKEFHPQDYSVNLLIVAVIVALVVLGALGMIIFRRRGSA